MQGDYLATCEYIERAILAGAPELVRFELGQAHFLLDDHDEARRHLIEARPALADDKAQLLLFQYYMQALRAGDLPASEFIQENIQFWRGEALKYSETAYGVHLAEIVADLGAEIEEG